MMLVGRSAYEFWRSEYGQHKLRQTPISSDKYPVDNECIKKMSFLSFPIELATFIKKPRSGYFEKYSSVKSKDKSIPAFQISENSYVCSPEHCLFTLSSNLTIAQLTIAASELCGSFRIKYYNGEARLERISPVTSIDAIMKYAKKHLSKASAKAFTEKLKYCVENAYSPPEIAVALFLHLPSQCGGYRLGKPRLNEKIVVNTNLQYAKNLDIQLKKGESKLYMKPDLYWPKHKLVVEYDSKEFHDNESSLGTDLRRRAALTKAGFKVLAVTNEQLSDLNAFHDVAEGALQSCGKRSANYNASSISRIKLHRALQQYVRSGLNV